MVQLCVKYECHTSTTSKIIFYIRSFEHTKFRSCYYDHITQFFLILFQFFLCILLKEMLFIVKPKCHLGPGGGEEEAAALQSKGDVAALLSSVPSLFGCYCCLH